MNSHSYTKRYLTVQHTNTHTNVQFRCLETPRRSSPLCMCGLWFSILNHEEKPPCRPQTWCPHLSLDSKTTDTTKNTNRDSLRPIQESHHGLIQLLQCLSICEPLLKPACNMSGHYRGDVKQDQTEAVLVHSTQPHCKILSQCASEVSCNHRQLFVMIVTRLQNNSRKIHKTNVFSGWPIISP